MKTSTKYIPGPWRISNNVHGIDNVKCWGVETDIFNHGIAAPGIPSFYTHVVANCGSTGKANAHLISQAPELLEVLESILNCCELNLDEMEPETNILIGRAQLVINKARGES